MCAVPVHGVSSVHEAAAEEDNDQALVRRLQQALGVPPDDEDPPAPDTAAFAHQQGSAPRRNRPPAPGGKTALDPAVPDEAIRIAEQILESAGTLARARTRLVDAQHLSDGR